jgi:hypothetical protein
MNYGGSYNCEYCNYYSFTNLLKDIMESFKIFNNATTVYMTYSNVNNYTAINIYEGDVLARHFKIDGKPVNFPKTQFEDIENLLKYSNF